MSSEALAGKTAIVTGASRGIGLATAEALAAAGANVVLTARTSEAADAAAEELNALKLSGVAAGFAAHAVDEEAAQACMQFTIQKFGRVDILVNNAGTNPAFGPLSEQNRVRFTKTFDVNVWAPLLWSNLAASAWMSEHGGAIVNVASVGGLVVEPNLGVYNASKAALIHLTKQQAFELSPKVRVNAVAPGIVRTRLAETLWSGHEEALNAASPLGRIGEPSDVGSAVTFLASDAASWITGTTLLIDGGALLGNAAAGREEAQRRKEAAGV